MSKLSEITEGCLNYAKQEFGILSPEIEKLGIYRSAICSTCSYAEDNKYLGYKCTKCGCSLKLKCISPKSQCPVGYWSAVEDIEIKIINK